jgi:hypothetical protein
MRRGCRYPLDYLTEVVFLLISAKDMPRNNNNTTTASASVTS